MKNMLTQDFIQSHLASVHNYDSFGRSLIAQILEESSKQVAEKSKEEVQLTIDISVKATEKDCIEFCCSLTGYWICLHLPPRNN